MLAVRTGPWAAVGVFTALTVGIAAWSVSTSPTADAPHAAVMFRAPTVALRPTPTSPSSSVAPPGRTVPTTDVDPATYHPNYDTIASLADDSTEVFIGTTRPLSHDPTDGGTVASFTVVQFLRGLPLDTLAYPEIPEGQTGDVSVTSGHTYLVFWSGGNGEGETSCIVGGARGLFSYDSAAKRVTRVATGPSRIPTTLTLSQVMEQLPDPDVPVREIEPPPPICSPSVTGS